MKNVKIKIMPLAALLLIMAATMLTLAEDLYNTSQLGQVTRKQEVYGLQVNDSFLIKGPFWYPSSASRNYLLLSDSRGFATWGQLPDTLPTQHHFTNRVTAQYFAIDTMLFTKHLTSGVVKTTTGGGVYVDTIPPNWCDSIANCINEQAWGLTGNSGTTAGTNFIGTTDSKSLYFKTKNTTAIVVDTNQNVGIGTAAPAFALDIGNGSTGPITLRINSAITRAAQLVLSQNSVTKSTVGVAGVPNNIINGTVLGDMGIRNSSNIYFSTDGGVSINMALSSAGRLGIGNSAPTSTLQTAGSFSAPISAKTANYTLTVSDHTVTFNGTSLTATLPAASGATGRIYCIVNYNATTLTVSTYKDLNNADATTLGANSALWLQSDGTNWRKIN